MDKKEAIKIIQDTLDRLLMYETAWGDEKSEERERNQRTAIEVLKKL